MRIALFSYEFPPDTAFGGIASYAIQAARLLAGRGHAVTVFAGSPDRSAEYQEDGYRVVRVRSSVRAEFARAVLPDFRKQQELYGLDVIESPDIGAEAMYCVNDAREAALVTKLHTPTYLIEELGRMRLSLTQRLRFVAGALRRGQWPRLPRAGFYDAGSDPEARLARVADEVSAPSIAIGQRVWNDWGIAEDKRDVVPLPYTPSQALLDTPVETDTGRVVFVGRLEARKGILDLMEAIPAIARQCPRARFRFVGPAWPSPDRSLNMQEYLEKRLARYRDRLEFTGSVPPAEIPRQLAAADVAVFPSRWESFGLVCVEAMAAGRGVIGSWSGGMADILDRETCGRLVHPGQPRELAQQVVGLLRNPEERMRLGRLARQRVLDAFNGETIGAQMEASYQRAIERRRAAGPREYFSVEEPASPAAV